MKLLDAKDAIFGTLRDAVAAYVPSPVVYWPNVDPAGDERTPNPPDPTRPAIWFDVRPSTGGLASLGESGHRKARYGGVFAALVQTPLNRGTAESDRLSQTVIDAFQGKHVDGLWFRDVRVTDAGRRDNQYQQTVVGEYLFDDHGV